MSAGFAACQQRFALARVDGDAIGESVSVDGSKMAEQQIECDVGIEAGCALDVDIDAFGFAGFEFEFVGVEFDGEDICRCSDGDGVHLDRPVTAAAAGHIGFLHGLGDRDQFAGRALLFDGGCSCDANVGGDGFGVGGCFEDDAAIGGLACANLAAVRCDTFRQSLDLQLNCAAEAIFTNSAGKDDSAAAGAKPCFVRIECEVEVWLWAVDFQAIDEGIAATEVDIANFDDVGTIGWRSPGFNFGILIDDLVPFSEVIIFGGCRSVGAEDADDGIQLRLAAAGEYFDCDQITFDRGELETVDVSGGFDATVDAAGELQGLG